MIKRHQRSRMQDITKILSAQSDGVRNSPLISAFGEETSVRPRVDFDRLVPARVRSFETYVPSQPDADLCRLYGVDRLHRLNNNENPLGPPPAAREVIRSFDPQALSVYPNGDCRQLRVRLADLWHVDHDQIIVGNGVNEVISLIIKAFCETADNIVTADRTFAVAEWIAGFSGIET